MNAPADQPAAAPKALIRKWWQQMKDDSGERAELRRAKTLAEIVLTPAYNHLRCGLRGTGWRRVEPLALAAGVLAHVERDAGDIRLPALGAKPKIKGANPRLGELRFRRLLQYRGAEDLFGPMVRVIHLLDKTAPVASLAEDLYWWNDRTRRDWAFSYYDTLAAK